MNIFSRFMADFLPRWEGLTPILMVLMIEKSMLGGAWVVQLVKHLTFGFGSGHDLGVLGEPASRPSLLISRLCSHSLSDK